MKEWFRETHGCGFELLRHFLRRFFDSDIITTPGQMAPVLIGAFSLLLPWFQVIIGPLRMKYAHFSRMPVPEPYRQAVRADELWLITLMMASIGLLTAIKWQSLFPSLRDYRVLGSLPLRPRQIFLAKFLALLLITTAAIAVLNLVPAVLFPMVSGGRWAIKATGAGRMLVHTESCVAACYFFFFGFLGLQGVLLNLFRPRTFARIAGYLQGLLVAAMVILIVLSFSIDAQIAKALIKPAWSRWLPPVWFLGLYQSLLGDPDPVMHQLARTATTALWTAVVLALVTYLLSYRRHRALLVEGMAAPARSRPGMGVVLDWLLPEPRQQGVIVFMAKTLAGSSQHRMILMGYGGFGLAVLVSGMLGLKSVTGAERFIPACFIYAHVVLLLFLLLGLRHLFSIPTELAANWTFRITEGEGRRLWLDAVDRFVIGSGAVMLVLIPFPFEFLLLGWRAVSESILFVAFALLCYEGIFSSWEKLPFTCSYLPGKTPVLVMALWLLGLLTALPIVNGILLECLYHPWAYAVVLALLLALWRNIRGTRREAWGDLRIKYDDLPEPAVNGLKLFG